MLAESGAIACPVCTYRVEMRNGVAEFARELVDDEVSIRTQASFGYEWTHFSDWRPSGEVNCQDYFTGFDLSSLGTATVLDAGCGMGRHARFIAPHALHLVAVDFSVAIHEAAHNVREFQNVSLLRADLRNLPLQDASFDFIYSLGVLHHIADTQGTIASLVAKLRPAGRLRVYVYWARGGWIGQLLRVVTFARRVTTKLPFGVLRFVCWILSVTLTATVIWPYRVAHRLGADRVSSWPLFVYTKYPFRVLYNDQFDRFSAPIEKRYTAAGACDLLESAGLVDVKVIERFGWIVEGLKPT
jgi:SAM-dependent methyltransferase